MRIRFFFGWAVCFLSAALTCPARAEDRQAMENELFAADSLAATATAASVPAATAPLPQVLRMTPDAKSVGFSGQITTAFADVVSNTLDANFLYTLSVADIFLDARLPQSAKVFANVEATLVSQSRLTSVALQELFLDFNLDWKVYFRTGKQVLQWGRCYLWNPTDLINVERIPFVRKIGTREGAYGMKMHIPLGVVANVYGFLDTHTATDAQNIAAALKTEFLMGNFEIAFSGWGKKYHYPVWGLDFSTRVLGVDTLGEISLTQQDQYMRPVVEDGLLFVRPGGAMWAPKASLNISRGFTPGDFKDQLNVMLEGYYDRAGFDSNPLADPRRYSFGQPSLPPSGYGPLVSEGTMKDFVDLNRLYTPNYFSRAYAALFFTWNRFLLSDMTLNLNCIRNLVDQTSQVSAGLTYASLNSFTAGLLANGILGQDGEYNFSGEKYLFQLTLAIAF